MIRATLGMAEIRLLIDSHACSTAWATYGGRRRAARSIAGWAVFGLMAAYAPRSLAQALPAGDPPEAAQVPDAPERGQAASSSEDSANVPDSTEQGQTQLAESFEHRPIAALLHSSSLVGLRDTTFSVQLRSFYEDTENFNTSTSLAWVGGGSAGVKTGYFWDFLALGATGYTSQRLYAPLDESGTKLLQPDQRPYTVIGELYTEFRLTDEILATAGRRGFDTPFINTQDSLMTPNTFEVYSVQGVVGSSDAASLHFGAGYVDQIKPRNSEDFESMATAAGAPGGVDRGVYVAGANYTLGTFSLGAVDYYSSDIINIEYAEVKYTIPLPDKLRLQFGAQYANQRSTGDTLLTGKPFATDQYGLKAELAIGSGLITLARTITAVGTTTDTASGVSGTSMRNPWGGYPGYTAVQVENFYRAGEDATLVRAAYNFPKKTGLSVYALWVHGSTPAIVKQYAEEEYDLNLQWTAKSAALKGLSVRARYGHVSEQGPADQHENDLRLMLYYQLR
jgi:hypothetical protein